MLQQFQNFFAQYGIGIISAIALIIIGSVAFRVYAQRWIAKKQREFRNKQAYILLAIDVPSQGEQSPKGVEQIFSQLSTAAIARGSFQDRWLQGIIQIPFSFEIISIDGDIQFLVHTLEVHKELVEAAIYAQYPDAEIYPVEDYTAQADQWPREGIEIWGGQLTLQNAQYFPIRTYPYFEHTFFKKFNDPLIATLETLGKIGHGEQIWIQFILNPTDDLQWKDEAEKKAKDITGSTKAEEEKKTELTPGEKVIVEAIQTKAAKIGYYTTIRILYWSARTGNKDKRISSLLGSFKQYTSLNLNGFKVAKEDPSLVLAQYKSRLPSKGFILNTEELATLWHFPAMDMSSQRVKSTAGKRFTPPKGLPYELLEPELRKQVDPESVPEPPQNLPIST